MEQIIGYILAIFVGITLGLMGSGGSILSVPILVYIMKVEPVVATAYSLFIVGNTALVGGVQKAKLQLVDYRKVLLFGFPTIIAVFLTRRFLVINIPEIIVLSQDFQIKKSVLIMVVFAVVMIFAAVKMLQPLQPTVVDNNQKPHFYKIVVAGLAIGLVAGFVGAGGGFLIIPALVLLTKTPMKMAIGTSLFIVASQSLIGFLGDMGNFTIDWNMLIPFTMCAIVGIFIGNFLSKKIDGSRLKTAFGYFVLFMGIYIIIKEIF